MLVQQQLCAYHELPVAVNEALTIKHTPCCALLCSRDNALVSAEDKEQRKPLPLLFLQQFKQTCGTPSNAAATTLASRRRTRSG